MGKKSRRPNRNKPKDIPAVASTAVAAPRQMITSAPDDAAALLIATFSQLCVSQDCEGILELESEMSGIARTFESSNPGLAGSINYNLGTAHTFLGREGGIEEATVYFKKTIEMAKQAGNNDILLSDGMLGLAQCYVKMGRAQEAMDLHKSLCDEIGKESMNPVAIVELAGVFLKNSKISRALEIFEEHLEAIESSWENQNQCLAYEMIASLYCKKNDFAESNVYFERQLSIAKETNNVTFEASALNGLGFNYGRMGDYGKAMAYLEEALVIESERGDDRKGLTHCAMGDVLVAQEGREKEAIVMYQKCVGLFEQGNATSEALILLFLKLGQACRLIEAWDDAIATLEKGLWIAESIEDERLGNQLKARSTQDLGNTYLEKYESLPERNDELIRKALFWSEAAFHLPKEFANFALFLDLAQEHYFLGDLEKAHAALKRYLDGSVRLGPSYCQACYQTCAKDAIMEKCSVCKVARYCSQAHSVHAWKKGRLCHKVMCPLLKRWRKFTESKGTTTELCDKVFNDFFERVLDSKRK